MKLLVFAHVPPPHHGQSYMVKLMLDGLGGNQAGTVGGKPSPHGIDCYHVNARLSTDLADVGEVRFGKLGLLLCYCLKAIWFRFRYGVKNFYYVPAPGKTPAMLRDWMVMILCRPFFDRTILHWHAAGMVKWLETSKNAFFQGMTRWCLGRADLCILLSRYSCGEIEKLAPRITSVVSNGIPDPCPNYATEILPRRQHRVACRRKLVSGGTLNEVESAAANGDPECLRVLYLTHCARDKGLFDCIEGVAQAAAQLKSARSPIRIEITVAGQFPNPTEHAEFEARIRRPDLLGTDGQSIVHYRGFLADEAKWQAFREADCFCFPTYYHAESFGLVLVEAMAFGLPIITTRWRSVPELLPEDYDGLVNPKAPAEIAEKLLTIISRGTGESLRQRFAEKYRADIHIARLAEALISVEATRDPLKTQSPAPTKVLVFAHTPPPHHGQSYMVQHMLSGFGGDQRTGTTPPSDHGIACYHVNARLSRDLEDVGEARLGKLVVLFAYCLAAIWCRFRYGPRVFYYVPAPGKPAALVRDWMVMLLCRPFYRNLVFHWHAAGLGHWLDTSTGAFTRGVTQRTLGRPSLSIVISDFNRVDAEKLRSRQITRVDYGIPDPCPDFNASLLTERTKRAMSFRALLAAKPDPPPASEAAFTVLFLANCLRTKGIFDALEAFLKLRGRLRDESPTLRLRFQIGGAFGEAVEQRRFEQRITESGAAGDIEYLGFVSGERKDRALRTADLLCFPTYYPGENQPLVLIESLAYGLPAVTTNWRSIPSIFPPNYAEIVSPQDVPAITEAMWQLIPFNDHRRLREHFCEHFTLDAHLRKLAYAIRSVA